MTVQTIAAISSSLIALLSAAVAIAVFRRQRRQAHFELARSLHQDLTSGEVARDLLATLHYPGSRTLDNTAAAETVRSAYFTVLWCFERVHAGQLVLANAPTARRLLDDLIRWHVTEWAQRIGDVKPILVTHFAGLDDTDSRKSLDQLVNMLTTDTPS